MSVLHIGIASFENPQAIDRAIKSIQAKTDGPWKLLVVDNASPDPAVRTVLEAAATDPRITIEFRDDNIGYVGAVNRIIEWADSEGADYVAYCDNDAEIRTQSWDTKMLDVLSRHHEVAMVCPKQYGAYPIPQAGWTEILWGLGCFWMLKRPSIMQPLKDIGPFDESLGHQEEVDYQLRLRLEGWAIAGVDIDVLHQAKATSSPEAQARITAGVVNFVNKWCAYFGGKDLNYHSPNVLRFEDWNVVALYLERYWLTKVPTLNESPDVIMIDGRPYALLKVPRCAFHWGGPNEELSTLYKGRII